MSFPSKFQIGSCSYFAIDYRYIIYHLQFKLFFSQLRKFEAEVPVNFVLSYLKCYWNFKSKHFDNPLHDPSVLADRPIFSAPESTLLSSVLRKHLIVSQFSFFSVFH